MNSTSDRDPPQAWLARAVQAGWSVHGDVLTKAFAFPDFDHTMAFVNAVAGIARAENHHPDMLIQDRRCELRWTSHDCGALTARDGRCAALADRLLP